MGHPHRRTACALVAALLLAGAAPPDAPTPTAAPAPDNNLAPAEPPVLIESQRFELGTLTLSGRAQCFDDGKPKGVCTTSLHVAAPGAGCDAPPAVGGEAPAAVASGGGWSLSGLAPGTLYALYARSSDGAKTHCSQPIRVQTPRDDSALEAPSLDPVAERIESPLIVHGVTAEALLRIYRNGKPVGDLVAPLAWGEFIATVPLAKGRNRIEVRAVNPYSGEQSKPSNAIELRFEP